MRWDTRLKLAMRMMELGSPRLMKVTGSDDGQDVDCWDFARGQEGSLNFKFTPTTSFVPLISTIFQPKHHSALTVCLTAIEHCLWRNVEAQAHQEPVNLQD
jgi:hypothetical protein